MTLVVTAISQVLMPKTEVQFLIGSFLIFVPAFSSTIIRFYVKMVKIRCLIFFLLPIYFFIFVTKYFLNASNCNRKDNHTNQTQPPNTDDTSQQPTPPPYNSSQPLPKQDTPPDLTNEVLKSQHNNEENTTPPPNNSSQPLEARVQWLLA